MYLNVFRCNTRLLQVAANLFALVTLEVNYPPPNWALHYITVTTLSSVSL
jgi:hypothetical protein